VGSVLRSFAMEEPKQQSKDDAVNDYLRRFDKHKQTQSQSKSAATYGITLALFVLFAVALGVVLFGYFYEMDYLKHTEPHNLDLHEFDEKVDTGKNVSTTKVVQDDSVKSEDQSPTARTLAAVADQIFNPEYSVDGCPDDKRMELWKDACKFFYNGKIFRRGEDGPLVAMMHSVNPGTHAASLLEQPDGTLLYAWFSGREGLAGVVIVVSSLAPGAHRWSPPKVVSSHQGRSNQNPVLFRDPTSSTTWLFHTSQAGGQGQGTAFIASLKSGDNGETWSQPAKMEGFKDTGPFVKGKFLTAANGRDWLVPMYYTPEGFGDFKTHYSAMLRTSDHGATWHQSLMSTKGQFLAQPTVVRLPSSGHLLAFFRDRKAQWIHTALSEDDGATWPSTQTRTRLPNNNSGIQAIVLANGNIVLVFNNLQGFARFPLSIALSEDEGKTFPYVRDLEAGGFGNDAVPPKSNKNRYSYPCVIQTHDGRIHVGYTYRRLTMKYVSIDEAWIRRGGTVGMFKGDALPISTAFEAQQGDVLAVGELERSE